MTIYEFVKALYDNAENPGEYMTAETAGIDLKNYRADGWTIPEDITPEAYREQYNEFVTAYNNGTEV